jgi:hypothetical protein
MSGEMGSHIACAAWVLPILNQDELAILFFFAQDRSQIFSLSSRATPGLSRCRSVRSGQLGDEGVISKVLGVDRTCRAY